MSAKILVVDDSRTIRVQLQKILSNAGFEVVFAENGLKENSLAMQWGEINKRTVVTNNILLLTAHFEYTL